jgi:hypothetical protein
MKWILVRIGGLVLGVLAVVIGISASDDGSRGDDPGAVDDMVVRWSQATPDLVDVDLAGLVGSEAVVIDTVDDREAFLARVPAGLRTEALEAVDLDTHLVVIGGYHRCTQSSSVVEGDRGWRFVVDDGDESIACAWSPYTVDVHAVPR